MSVGIHGRITLEIPNIVCREKKITQMEHSK